MATNFAHSVKTFLQTRLFLEWSPVAVAAGSNGKPLISILVPTPRAAPKLHRTPSAKGDQTVLASVKQALVTVDTTYQHAIKRYVDPIFGATRHQQMAEMNSAETEAIMAAYEKELNRNLGFAVIVVSVAAAAGQAVVPIVLICFPLAIYMTRMIFDRAYHAIVHERRMKMPVLGAVNVLATWLGGFYVVGGFSFVLYYLAEKLILITQDTSHQKLVNIFGQQPRFVWALVDGVEVEIGFEQLQLGDTIVIGAGQLIPVDGVITAGYASIDQHRLTGESQPAEKAVGDRVLAATVVLAGKLYVQVEKAGKTTAAAQIGEILNSTAGYQMAIESKAMQVVNASLTPTLVAAGLAWLMVSYEGAVAVTNSSFGFNIRMTGPIAMLNYLNLAAQRGILVKDGRSLELLHEIDTVIFDKTGTLTLDQPHVAQIHLFHDVTQATLLTYAAAVEVRQSHPIARAIVSAAKAQNLALPAINDAHYELGYGIKARIDSHLIRVGSDRFMALEQIDLPPTVAVLQQVAHDAGYSLVMVAIDDVLAGIIELEPTIRPEAQAIIADLRQRGKLVYVISGDQEEPTRKLTRSLGIDHYFANTLPEDKASHVARLQAEGRKVCFVGDGINDSIALKKAQVSVSLRGATSVATDTAQIVFMDGSLNQLPGLFRLAAQFDRNMKANFVADIVPGFLIVGGVFLLNLGVVASLVIYNISLVSGIGIAMLPLLQQRETHS